MSIWTDSLDAIYESDIGADAVLSLLTDSIRAIDKTTGVDVAPLGLANVPTLLPAACVRRASLTDAGITDLADLINATITLNGVTWRIVNHAYRPQPGGELEGEVYLLLRETS